ncbi:hypothetical protein RJ639_035037 [Escallonia herrerae]|uniref:SS18 N-terminal domain-containing protein n=1 Tax=Escallonia herrerae TaxID=1293975 RepID=A0AA88WS41_9ASTE|nr:hypothetical protein RJ639_035037 [Escallonia herrerae]
MGAGGQQQCADGVVDDEDLVHVVGVDRSLMMERVLRMEGLRRLKFRRNAFSSKAREVIRCIVYVSVCLGIIAQHAYENYEYSIPRVPRPPVPGVIGLPVTLKRVNENPNKASITCSRSLPPTSKTPLCPPLSHLTLAEHLVVLIIRGREGKASGGSSIRAKASEHNAAAAVHADAAEQQQPTAAGGFTTTDHIQKFLDENKSLILKILENQNSGKAGECAEGRKGKARRGSIRVKTSEHKIQQQQQQPTVAGGFTTTDITTDHIQQTLRNGQD